MFLLVQHRDRDIDDLVNGKREEGPLPAGPCLIPASEGVFSLPQNTFAFEKKQSLGSKCRCFFHCLLPFLCLLHVSGSLSSGVCALPACESPQCACHWPGQLSLPVFVFLDTSDTSHPSSLFSLSAPTAAKTPHAPAFSLYLSCEPSLSPLCIAPSASPYFLTFS